MNWAKIIALLTVSVVAAAQTQPPPPQTARQAVLEMFFSKTPKAMQKHLPDEALDIFAKTDPGLTPMILSQISSIQQQATMGGKHLETFEVGPLLLTSESTEGAHQQRIEIAVDRDDLSGDEDQIELSMRVYKDGALDKMPVLPNLILDMKQEKDIWRLSQITVAIHIPLTDPDYVKGIAESMRKTRQRMLEMGAIGTLQSLKGAEVSFQKSTSRGYTCNLPDLGKAGELAATGRMFGQNTDDGSEKRSDYVFKITDCSSSAFHITAEPAKGGAAKRAFCIDESAQPRFADDGKGSTCISSGKQLNEMYSGERGGSVIGMGAID